MSSNTSTNRVLHVGLCLGAASWCLIVALVPFHAYSVYQVSRWGICLAAIFLAQNCPRWSIPLVLVAIFFNPIIPFRLTKETWRLLDFAAAGVFGIASLIRPNPNNNRMAP